VYVPFVLLEFKLHELALTLDLKKEMVKLSKKL
jgi:hypothetical protein